jgi:Fic family protein
VEKNRATLAAPGKPEEHIHAHLAIANAYLAISAKEREAALALIDKHGLHDQFAGEFAQLRATYERELTREQKLSAQWKAQASDFINDERRAAVLAHLIEHGAINKSAYAELCSVGLATASKHLGQLAERGLLVQTGKGPSTRYVLPHE